MKIKSKENYILEKKKSKFNEKYGWKKKWNESKRNTHTRTDKVNSQNIAFYTWIISKKWSPRTLPLLKKREIRLQNLNPG